MIFHQSMEKVVAATATIATVQTHDMRKMIPGDSPFTPWRFYGRPRQSKGRGIRSVNSRVEWRRTRWYAPGVGMLDNLRKAHRDSDPCMALRQ